MISRMRETVGTERRTSLMIAKFLCVLLLAALWGMPEAAWAANVAPVANDQQTTLVEGSRASLLLSKTDPDSSPPFTHTLVSSPANGKLETNSGVMSDGSTTTSQFWYYTPHTGFSGTDSFTWKVSDGLAESNTATYTLIVSPNTVPKASNSQVTMLQGETRRLCGMPVNDPDLGQTRTFKFVTVPGQGTLEININGSYVKVTAGSTTGNSQAFYTPNAGFSGADSFTWKVSDGIAESNVATVSISVTPNTPPVIMHPTQELSFLKNSAGNELLPFLKWTDPDVKQTRTFTLVGAPARGQLRLGTTNLGTGSTVSSLAWTYTPNSGFEGKDSFTWRVHDGIDSSPQATVTIKVEAMTTANAPPEFEAGVQLMDGLEPLRVWRLATGATTYSYFNAYNHDRYHAAPELVDWNNDGLLDLLVGAADGRMALYLNKGTKQAPRFSGFQLLKYESGSYIYTYQNIKSNTGQRRCTCGGGGDSVGAPRVVDWDGDGKKDLISGAWGPWNPGNDASFGLTVCLNDGTDAAPAFTEQAFYVFRSTIPKDRTSGGRPTAMPYMTDFNGDGFLDLISGDNNVWYKEPGGENPAGPADGKPSNLVNLWLGAAGDLSMGRNFQVPYNILDWYSVRIKFFPFDKFYTPSERSTSFGIFPTRTFSGASPAASRKSVVAADWSGGDGKKDLLIGLQDGTIWFAPNTGTSSYPVFSSHIRLKAGGNDLVVGKYYSVGTDWGYKNRSVHYGGANIMYPANEAKLAVGDLNGDGLPDLVAGDMKGYVYLFEQVNNGGNVAPTANDLAVSTAEDTAVALTLKASDPNNDPLTFSIVSQPSHGTLSGTAPNLTYTPHAGYSGSDSLAFKVHDGTTSSNTATVSITVTAVNDVPMIDSSPWAHPNPVAIPGSSP